MHHARSPRQRAAGCLVFGAVLVAVSCTVVLVWLNTGTQPLEIELGVAGALVLPRYGPRRLVGSPFNGGRAELVYG